MKVKDIKTMFIFLLIVAYCVIYKLVIMTNFLKYSEMLTATFMMIITFMSYSFFGFQKNKFNFIKKETIIMIMTVIIGYFFVEYAIGIFIGFLKNSYSLKIMSIIKNTLWVTIIITFSELTRYICIKGNADNKISISLIFIALLMFDISYNIKITEFNFSYLFVITTISIIPIIIKQIMLTYLTYNVGIQHSLIYRLITELYVFIVPIIPDLGNYLNSMLNILLPSFVLVYSNKMLREYYNGIEREFYKSTFSLSDLPIYIIIILLVLLITGITPLQILSVGSESMTPKINKGDSVVINKNISDSDLKEGDIIAYYRNNKIVIHRIVEISNNNGKIIYNTKGDANDTDDNVKLTIKDIKGEVLLCIPYIGWPSVWASEEIE